MRPDDLVVGLDIGTTKICALIAERAGDRLGPVRGLGIVPSEGLRKGMVVNMESTVSAVGKAVEQAEAIAGCEVSSVYTGIAGGHIKGMNSRGAVTLRPGKEITRAEVDRAVDAAQAVTIPVDREVIHVLPREFILDGRRGIQNPVGMCGQTLEVEVHIVTAAVASASNIIKCVNRAGFAVEDIILQPLASAEAVLTPDERRLGVCLLDLGGGTTDIAVFVGGSVRHTEVLALGGDHVTSDLAIGLRCSVADAEEIKKKHGCAVRSMVDDDEAFSVTQTGGGTVELPAAALCEIIEPRVEEMFSIVRHELEKMGLLDLLGAGVVLTGGGALLRGIAEMAEWILGLPVRVGSPSGTGGDWDEQLAHPALSTAVGLVGYGLRWAGDGPSRALGGLELFRKVKERMTSWLKEFV